MSEKEKRILENVKISMDKMTDQEQDRVLAYTEGMAMAMGIRKEKEKHEGSEN